MTFLLTKKIIRISSIFLLSFCVRVCAEAASSSLSPVGHWSFDDAQGLVIPDDSGHDNHGKFIAWGIPIEKGRVRLCIYLMGE